MSSVVNKSKNKFAPKAKVRPRPGTTSAAAAAPQPTINATLQSLSKPSHPQQEGQADAALKLNIQERHEPAAMPRGGLHDEVHSEVPELPRPRIVTVPALKTTRVDGKQSIRQTSVEGSSSRPRIPAIRSAVRQIVPRIRSATAKAPSIRASSSEGGLSDGTTGQKKDKGKAVMSVGPEGSESGLSVQRPTGSETGDTQAMIQDDEESQGNLKGDSAAENWDDWGPSAVKSAAPNSTRKRKAKRAPASGLPGELTKKQRGAPRGRRKAVGDVNRERAEQTGQASEEEGSGSEENNFEELNNSKLKKPRRPRKAGGPRKVKGPRKPHAGRRREGSPEGGEGQEISPAVIKMKELCKDIRIGRKSKRFVELQQMDWKQAADNQKATNATLEAPETSRENIQEAADERQSTARGGAPQMRLVNGALVLDQESIQVNSHERDAIDEAAMEVVEENMAYRRVTSATWSRHKKVEKWDSDETQRFYNALSMFGTDFEIISKLFPARNRRQMRTKFIAEERKYPEKITAALRTRVLVDVDEYSQMADVEIGDPQIINDELEKIREAHEAEEQAAMGHAAEMERERQENANAAMRAGDDAAAAADHSKKGRKKKSAKDRATAGQGREEVLTMSREEYEAERLRELAEAEEL